MKKTYLGFAGLSLLLLLGTQTVHAQQGFGTDKPHKSAAVEIQSSKRGLLIPRVNLVETTNGVTPINAPEKSLMVYNQVKANDVTPGYYYWDGAKWVRFAYQSEIKEITLAGDVTGPTNATVVGAIQGVPVDGTTPTANQVLTFVPGTGTEKGKWTPTTITSSLISDAKGIKGTGITVGGTDNGAGSVLKEVTLSITHGGANQVMVTNADGNGTTWVDQSVISPTTINELISNGNTLTSTVNGVGDSVDIVNSIANTLNDKNELVTTVNGIATTGVDLTAAIEAGQKTTSVVKGSDKVTVVTTGAGTTGKNTEYTVDVVESELKLEKLGGELPVNKLVKGQDGQVLVTKEGVSTWVGQSEIVPTTTNTLTKKDNNGTVDQNTIVSTVTGSSVVTTVNGVPSESVDLKDAIQAGQKITTVVDGINTTVTSSVNPAGSSNTTEYKVNVSNDAIQASQKLTTVSQGAGVKVTPSTPTGSNTTDYNVAINTEGGKTGDVLTVVLPKEGTTTPSVEWKTPNYENIYTHDGTLTDDGRTVDFGVHTVLKFKRDTQVYDFTFDDSRIGLNMWGTQDSSIGLLTEGQINGEESKLKLYHDNSLSQINANSEKGLRISAFAHKDISLGKFYFKPGENNETFESTLIVKGDGGVQVTNINKPEFAGKSTDKVVVADKDGVLKTLKSIMPKFFYMPSVLVPTAESQATQSGVTYNNATRTGTINLYAIYQVQFGSPIKSSVGASPLPVLPASELGFHVTYATEGVFTIESITAEGLMTYKVSSTANVNVGSFINIVFSVKEDN